MPEDVARAGREGASPLWMRHAAGLLALAAFFVVPPGALPPLCNAWWGIAAFFVCLLPSFAARICLVPFIRIAGVAAVLALYAYQRGMPGSVCNFGTYVAMPLWHVVTLPGAAGLALLCCALTLELARLSVAGRHTQRLALACLPALYFFPWTAGLALPAGGGPILIVDFFLFWGKTLLIAFCLSRVKRLAARAPSPYFFSVAGALLLAVDLW